jgi:hypothetical protein
VLFYRAVPIKIRAGIACFYFLGSVDKKNRQKYRHVTPCPTSIFSYFHGQFPAVKKCKKPHLPRKIVIPISAPRGVCGVEGQALHR